MSDYDPADDIPGYSEIYANKNELIRGDLLLDSWCMFDFYIQNQVDKSIDNWEDFLNKLVDDYELIPYSIDNSYKNDDSGKMRFVSEPICHEGLPNCFCYFFLDDIHEISKQYGIITNDKFKINMESLLERFEFLINCYKNIAIDKQNSNELSIEGQIEREEKAQNVSCINITTPKTAPATIAKQEKSVENWKQAFRHMFKIGSSILNNPPQELQTWQINNMFKKSGYEPTGTQMKFFKSLLPDGYVDRTGGDWRRKK